MLSTRTEVLSIPYILAHVRTWKSWAKNWILFLKNELKLRESRFFFIRGAPPPAPPVFFCHLVKVRLVFIIFIRGAQPPFFFIRKAPTRWLPRTPCSYDQREGSWEPPHGFADARRGQSFGHRVQINCGQQFFDATRRTRNCPPTPILPTDTVANSLTLQKYKVIFTMIFCIFHKSCISFLTAIFSETHWCNPFFPT